MGVGDVVWFLFNNAIVSAMIVYIVQEDTGIYDYATKTVTATSTKVAMHLIGADETIYHIKDVEAKKMFTTKAALIADLTAEAGV